MKICYSKASAPSAHAIADELIDMGVDVELVRGSNGDINWGRADTNATLNASIENVTNKRRMRELFAEHEVPMPRLIRTTDSIFPIVGRPDHHTRGRGFWLCHNLLDVVRAKNGITYRNGKLKAAATHFMEYIPKTVAPDEYRVHVFLGKSIRISKKLFDETGEYTTLKPDREKVKHIRKAAKKAVAAVGLDFGTVDILANDDECWVLEVNSAAGLGGSTPKLWATTFKQYMEGEWDE